MRHILSTNKIIVYLFPFLIAFSTFSGIFRLSTYYYIGTIFTFFLYTLIFGSKGLKIGSKIVLLFLLICILSILVNQPPSYFRAWERLALFFMTLCSFSPLIVSKGFNRNRFLLFHGLVKFMLVFAVASFFGFFGGVNFFVRNGDLLAYNEAGHFSGFTNHSMVLAPISAISGIYSLARALSQRNKKNKIFWWGITLVCIGSVLLSASRGSLGGIVLAITVILYRYNLGHIGKFIRYAAKGVVVAVIFFPLWGGLSQYVLDKNESNLTQGGIMYSRETKMAARLYEIQHNFISGVGFSVIDETVDSVDRTTGTIEPNSSWLGVFSMTGIFGFIIFLSIFIHAFISAYRKIPDIENAVLL